MAVDHNDWAYAAVDVRPYEPNPPEPEPTNIFIQWKNTSVCFDIWCECGAVGHFDGYFAYAVKCVGCGKFYAMPSTVYLAEVSEDFHPCVVVPEND